MIDSVGQSGGTQAEVNYRLLHSQGGMGSGLFIRGRCNSRVLEMELGFRASIDERPRDPAVQPAITKIEQALTGQALRVKQTASGRLEMHQRYPLPRRCLNQRFQSGRSGRHLRHRLRHRRLSQEKAH